MSETEGRPLDGSAVDRALANPILVIEPGTDLLERARAGWERFLSTLGGAFDE
ncbi:hypothetical protein [Streptomyces sp. NPDC047976]|uniref:hypothetical protein n=1 Tax=Streptomyces sp. NPDC047976 TaxID=3155746 RepID=UPI003428A7C4